MIKLFLKHHKLIAVIVAITFLVTAVPMIIGGIKANQVKAASNSDNSTAGEISNMTGVKVEEILKLRNEGMSWNEILDTLKNNSSSNIISEKDKRNKLLAQNEFGEEYIKKLKKEGFTDSEISEVKLLVDRLVFQLQELTSDLRKTVSVPKAEISEKTEDTTQTYSELLGKIDIKVASYLMLKLKKDFFGIKKVLDEYIYSLQLGINLEEYLIDKKTYQKQKDEKSAGFDQKKIITLQKLDEKVLEKIQEENKQNINKEVSDTGKLKISDKSEEKNVLPEIPNPKVENIKPKNPADEILDEIKSINPTGN